MFILSPRSHRSGPAIGRIFLLWRMAFRCSQSEGNRHKGSENRRKNNARGLLMARTRKTVSSRIPPPKKLFPAPPRTPLSSSKHAIFRSFFASPRRPLKTHRRFKKGGKSRGFLRSHSTRLTPRSPVSDGKTLGREKRGEKEKFFPLQGLSVLRSSEFPGWVSA